MATVEPVTTSGWYENTDGTVSRYTWRSGQLDLDRTVPSWAEVPSREEEQAALVPPAAQ
jgi:hypothetical protein